MFVGVSDALEVFFFELVFFRVRIRIAWSQKILMNCSRSSSVSKLLIGLKLRRRDDQGHILFWPVLGRLSLAQTFPCAAFDPEFG